MSPVIDNNNRGHIGVAPVHSCVSPVIIINNRGTHLYPLLLVITTGDTHVCPLLLIIIIWDAQLGVDNFHVN